MRLLFCRGHGLISALIRWQTWGRYSHVAIEIGGWVYEAVPRRGVRKTPAAKYNWVNVDVFTTDFGDRFDIPIREFLEDKLGRSYDYLGVLRFIPRWKEVHSQSKRYFCSELVFAALDWIIPARLLERVPGVKVSPSLLSYSPRLRNA